MFIQNATFEMTEANKKKSHMILFRKTMPSIYFLSLIPAVCKQTVNLDMQLIIRKSLILEMGIMDFLLIDKNCTICGTTWFTIDKKYP